MHVIKEDGFTIYRFLVEYSANNFNYIVSCDETKESIVIDPIDVITIMEIIRENNLRVNYVVNTHTHPDHIHGNNPIIKVFLESKILVHKAGQDNVSPRSETIDEGDEIKFGRLNMKVFHTPGHCPDHLTLKIGNHLFIGDTVFVAGCGNTRYGGDPEILYETFVNKVANFDENLKLLVGHSYAENNLKFALSIDPSSQAAKDKLKEVREVGERITTIGEEKKYNPFMRLDDPNIISGLKKNDPNMPDDPKSVFIKLRELRNSW
ncbi:MAG: hydroxyacylglutathione hydrolase C-terminal domain-containing protein [Thermodesulfobacteriota bacterium]